MTPTAKKLLAAAVILLCGGGFLIFKGKPAKTSVFAGNNPPVQQTQAPVETWGGTPTQFANQSKTVRVLKEKSFTTGFCETRLNPVWTIYTVKPGSERISLATSPKEIQPNRSLPPSKQADSREFLATKMAPAPMAPRGIGGTEALKASNICVQEPTLNQTTWAALEELEIRYAGRYGEIQITTGPIFLPSKSETFGKSLQARIPDGFYKIMIRRDEGKLRALAFIIPQQATGTTLKDLEAMLGRIAQIEKDTKLNLLPNLDEVEGNRIKRVHETEIWE